MNNCDDKYKQDQMFESALWVPLALLGLIILAAIFFSQQS
jgi:hypothetical protein